MEETLGKRIAYHRKRLGLTQDALAEKLGITAQAVSKWENDLSCPDIAIIPQLAAIFGITTDALLGRQEEEKVFEAEVVNDDNPGIHFENNSGAWSFHWDSGRLHSLLSAICVLLVGGLTIWTRVTERDVSFWSILWPSAVLFWGLGGVLRRFSVFSSACILFGGYYLVSNLGLWKVEFSNNLIFPICVVLFGLSLLIDAFRKPKKPKFRVVKHGGNSKKTKVDCSNQTHSFSCDVSFGSMTHEVNVSRLEHGNADVSFGELIIDLSGVEEIAPGCRIHADCSFGELHFRIPRKYYVEVNEDTSFADMHILGQPDDAPQATIILDADVSFGGITLIYI